MLAVWNESDQWHRAAAAAFAKLLDSDAVLLTTTFILLECGNAAARRPFRREADELRRQFEHVGALIYPEESDWEAAWDAYVRGEADAAGIVDQVSFTVMRRLGLRAAFTNDRHFRAAGFDLLF
jgi:predicted nucleic acid-binding protein